MRPTTAGHTQQSSVGYLITRDTTSVRHEKPRSVQTREMIDHAAAPLKKRPARDTAAWQATLLAAPEALVREIGVRHDEAVRLLAHARTAAQGRSGASRIRRTLASVASVPDKGNVKANSVKAIQLHRAGTPARSGHGKLTDQQEQQAGFASMSDHLALMGATHRRKQLAQLQQEADELMDVIAAARDKSTDIRHSTSLSAGARIERQQLLDALCSDPLAAKKALATRIERCDTLGADIASHQQQQARLSGINQHDSQADARLAELTCQLTRAQELRDVALGLQAPGAAETVLPRLRQLSHTLAELADDADRELTRSRNALDSAQHAEIEGALAALRGLDVHYDRNAAQSFVRARMGACIGKAGDVGAHAIPAPLLVDIYIGALARTSRHPAKLDDAAHARAMETIAALPGGMLAWEQISGIKLEKEPRIAIRVAAMANITRARLRAAGQTGPRLILLEQAALAAVRVQASGTLDGCSELQCACYSAVRNGFAVQLENDAGLDALLVKVDSRLAKMMSEWIDDGQPARGLRNPMKRKNPVDARMLRMAALTSTLGYDVPERPMARLDDAIRAVVTHLDAIVPLAPGEAGAPPLARTGTLPAASLDTGQVLALAAVLLAQRKGSLQAPVRPGHVSLDASDAPELLALVQGRLGPLIRAGAAAADLTGARNYIDAHGEHAASPTALVQLFDRIGGHIGIPPGSSDAARSHQHCLDNVGIMRHMIAQTETTRVASRQEMYDFLGPKFEQFELRGKLKMAAGGSGGISTKAFTWPLDIDPGALALVLPVRGEAKASRTRSAVLEVGLSTTGAELFAGSEKRMTYAGGGGVGLRIGYESLISSGGGVDKTLAHERADTGGVWLRVPRDGNDRLTRRQAARMAHTLCGLDQGGPGPDGADTRIGAFIEHQGTRIMPRIVGELLARHPNLSISSVDTYREELLRNEVVPAASLLNLAGGSGEGAARVQFLGGGMRSERRNKIYFQSDATGFMRITRSNALSGGSAWGQASFLSVNGLFEIDPTAGASQQYGGLGASRQFAESGVDTKLRYITRDGETNAVDTRIDIEDVNFTHHLARVNGCQQELIALGAEQLFKNVEHKPPLHEQKRVAKQWLYDILQQAEEKSKGNSRHVFSISNCLKPSAAAVIDGLAAKAALARMDGKEHWATPAERQIDKVLQHKDSFRPWKVTTSERTSEGRQVGLTYGVNATTTRRADGQRGTSSYPA